MTVKTIEEWLYNYAQSAVLGAIRYKQKLIKKGWPEDKAIKDACSYALGMMKSSGKSPQECIEILGEIEAAAGGMRRGLQEIFKSSD